MLLCAPSRLNILIEEHNRRGGPPLLILAQAIWHWRQPLVRDGARHLGHHALHGLFQAHLPSRHHGRTPGINTSRAPGPGHLALGEEKKKRAREPGLPIPKFQILIRPQQLLSVQTCLTRWASHRRVASLAYFGLHAAITAPASPQATTSAASHRSRTCFLHTHFPLQNEWYVDNWAKRSVQTVICGQALSLRKAAEASCRSSTRPSQHPPWYFSPLTSRNTGRKVVPRSTTGAQSVSHPGAGQGSNGAMGRHPSSCVCSSFF